MQLIRITNILLQCIIIRNGIYFEGLEFVGEEESAPIVILFLKADRIVCEKSLVCTTVDSNWYVGRKVFYVSAGHQLQVIDKNVLVFPLKGQYKN